ncbi:aminoglycoside N(3)-acetyltransferase [Paenibacillus turpanensis]|uniref:aminoglycoside N(3)-acetyltransferase n=1 Tax=Paenibacillus turpanensis TaxID=2689078 RepID=UPI0014072F0F|nr:AAC(3) family N-acetyltransferase [Paenibacillus turpanensis]
MPLKEIIEQTKGLPATVGSIEEELRELGVQEGMSLLVHSSLSRIGWVNGGAQAVILGLMRAVGDAGTLIMPAHTSGYSDPAEWGNPPIPKEWWAHVRETMPAYDPALTPCDWMGMIAETFRKADGVRRSAHPHHSFAAWGSVRDRVVDGHRLEFSLGEGSPLARVYDAAGWVLLLGVGHDSNTSLHLSEHRANYASKRVKQAGAPVMQDGARVWAEFAQLEYETDDFPVVGEAFAKQSSLVRQGRVGQADALLMPQRELVDFGVTWMEANRK